MNIIKTTKFTVLCTIESFYPYMSGPANQAFRISKELEKRGIKAPILTSTYKAKEQADQSSGIHHFIIQKWRLENEAY